MEPGVQTPEETLEKASGSCRDSAWLMVQLLRHCGLAARFVSGYLIQLKSDVKALDGPSGTEVDFTDLHAWCEVYLPGAGWVGLDATSGLLAGEGHIPLACTPQPSSAAPIEGGVDECEVEFAHHMQVTRIYESPRVTLPYTDDQWAAVMALGAEVDEELQSGRRAPDHGRRADLRGRGTTATPPNGTPTRWARPSAAWPPHWCTSCAPNTARAASCTSARASGTRASNCHAGPWASTGARTASPAGATRPCSPTSAPPATTPAKTHAASRTCWPSKLGVTGKHIEAGHEDVWYYLWRERRLPVNVDPFDSKLDDEMERSRLRRVFEQKLDAVIGYVLPLQAPEAGAVVSGSRWRTGPWFLRDERMYLMPGDSPMGYRLPLDSLPWVSKSDYPYLIEQDPYAVRTALPHAATLRAQYNALQDGPTDYTAHTTGGGFAEGGVVAVQGQGHGTGSAASRLSAARANLLGQAQPSHASTTVDANRMPKPGESAHWINRSALCVEVRDPRRANGPKAEAVGTKSGVLYVFMPPVALLEDYLDLLAAIEATAEQLESENRAGRLPAAARPAPEGAGRHARPRRDRGQHPPREAAGANWWSTPSSSTTPRSRPACRPRSS